MTRTSDDWREAAQENIEDTLDDVFVELKRHQANLTGEADDLRKLAHDEDAERVELREAVVDLRDALKLLGDDAYDWAYDVHTFQSGSTLRNLQGKEPAGYSKRDGGVAHDALYGSNAQVAQYARHIQWPLDLSEWDKETADVPPKKHPGTGERIPVQPDDISPVTAEGTTKYTRRVGGREVYLVVDERTRNPPV